MVSKAIIKLFRERNPGVRIRPKVKPATAELAVKIKPSHARSARVDDACECTGAHALKGKRGILDAYVGLGYTYALVDVGGGNAEVTKYRTTPQARSVIDANDAGLNVFGFEMRFAPLPPSASPGARKGELERQPRVQKQADEHVNKRIESRRKTAGRRLLSNASRGHD